MNMAWTALHLSVSVSGSASRGEFAALQGWQSKNMTLDIVTNKPVRDSIPGRKLHVYELMELNFLVSTLKGLPEMHVVESSVCVEQVVFSQCCCPVVMFMM